MKQGELLDTVSASSRDDLALIGMLAVAGASDWLRAAIAGFDVLHVGDSAGIKARIKALQAEEATK